MLFYMQILGAKYKVKIVKEENEVMREKGACGYVNIVDKIIYVLDDETKDETLRHEIIHAFMYESGIGIGYLFHDEPTVDWLAVQIPKMVEAMKKEGCL